MSMGVYSSSRWVCRCTHASDMSSGVPGGTDASSSSSLKVGPRSSQRETTWSHVAVDPSSRSRPMEGLLTVAPSPATTDTRGHPRPLPQEPNKPPP